MSTPGRRKALKALAAAKRKNKARIAKGKKPVLEGKPVAIKTFVKKTGTKIVKREGKKTPVRKTSRKRGG